MLEVLIVLLLRSCTHYESNRCTDCPVGQRFPTAISFHGIAFLENTVPESSRCPSDKLCVKINGKIRIQLSSDKTEPRC